MLPKPKAPGTFRLSIAKPNIAGKSVSFKIFSLTRRIVSDPPDPGARLHLPYMVNGLANLQKVPGKISGKDFL